MHRTAKLLLALALLLFAGVIGWRIASRRRAFPCPAWLAALVDNPFMDAVHGDRMLDRAGVAPGQRVLDAGAGPGRLTVPLAERVGPAGRVVALDVQRGMLARLERRLQAHGVGNVTPVLGGLGDGLLPLSSFDRAFLVTVLGEVPDRLRALREIYAALKPGGILVVSELIPDPHFESQNTVRRLGEAAGFRVGAVFGSALAYSMHLVKPEGGSA